MQNVIVNYLDNNNSTNIQLYYSHFSQLDFRRCCSNSLISLGPNQTEKSLKTDLSLGSVIMLYRDVLETCTANLKQFCPQKLLKNIKSLH